jgi:predicted aldo/keto reductase-like oxidoreductase
MHYRRFGKLDFKASGLGFGAMRLPVIGNAIDEAQALAMIRYAIDNGVNYVDTAYPYHGGESEGLVGRALKDGYREKVKVATKLPCWDVKTRADFDTFLDRQLARLSMDSVDFYLLHSLNGDSWARMRDLGVLDWAEKAMAQGRFQHLAFSFHGDFDAFKAIVDAYDWPMVQIQYNFADPDAQAGARGLRYAASKGAAVVIMEPLFGGKLVNPPAVVQELWDSVGTKRACVDWALRWLWNQPEVSMVLSGMSSMEQTRENVALAADPDCGVLTRDETALFDRVRAAYKGLTVIPCTACGYCMPCPRGVDIPGNMAAYNEGFAFDKPDGARGQYSWWKYAYEVQHILDHDVRAARCEQCGDCNDKCPQGIPVSKWMTVIDSVLGNGKPWVTQVE